MAPVGATDSATQRHPLPLPAKCPELNPVENVWQFLRNNWLSNRIFRCERDIVDHCCHARNKLVEQPWRDHVDRPGRLGAWVLISVNWYKPPPLRPTATP
jgi:hypothetical protein